MGRAHGDRKTRLLGAVLFGLLMAVAPSWAHHATPSGRRPVQKYRVGVYQNPPKVYLDENEVPRGIFVDLIEAIAQAEGWKVEYVYGTWSQCLESLEKHAIDLMPDVAFSREREEKYDFHHVSAVESWSQLYARPGARIAEARDLDGKRVAILKGAIQRKEIQRMMEGFGYRVTFVETESLPDAFAATAKGKADVAVANRHFGDHSYRKYGLLRTPIIFEPASLYFVTAKGYNAPLLKAVDRNLKAWKEEPESPYYKILSGWMDRPPARKMSRRLLVVLAGVLGIVLLSASVIFLLRSQVKAKTRGLEEANRLLRERDQTLRDKVKEMDQIFNCLPEALIYMDAERQIVKVNPAFVRVFGYGQEEVIGKKPSFIYEDFQDYEAQGLARFNAKASESVDLYRARFRRKDGRVFEGEAVGTVIRAAENRKVTGMVALVRDITDRDQGPASS